jgi:hypothetical protein
MKLVAIQLANLKYRLPYKESHMRKLTHAEYVRKVQGIHKGNIEIISKFDGTRNPVKYRCNVCGFIGEKHANNLIHTKPQGCVRCGVSSRPQCQPMSAAEIKRKMLKATNYKIIGGEVTDGGRDYVLVQCKVCKRQCEVRPFLYRNSGDNHYGDSCCKGEASAKNSSKQASKLKVIKLAGKIHKVRGYEPYAIAYILKHKKIPATDIVTESSEIPKIPYFVRRPRVHTPDIYIASKRILVEVKSVYTAGLLKDSDRERFCWESLVQKSLNAKKLGFRYFVLVMSYKGERIELPKNWEKLTHRQIRKWYNQK